MKKILIALISFLPVAAFAQLVNSDTIGMPSHNQAVGRSFQVGGDTLLHLGTTVLLPYVTAAGSAVDSVLVKDTATGKVKLRPQTSSTESSANCNYSAGSGAMNANNNSSSNTNVGINAGHNIISSGLRNTNEGCNAGTGTTGGDDNVYVGYNTGNSGNFSNVTAVGTALTATASGQTLFPAVSGDVYFGGVSSAGAFANLILQGGERTGPNASGNSVTLKGGRGTGTGTPGDINLYTYNTGSSGSTPQTGTTKLVVKGNGNVGIGTTSPSARLHLSNGALKYENGSQGLGKVLYDSTGSGDVTYITLPTIETGHYLPAVTLTSNLDTVIADSAKYSRVGDIVTVSGRLSNVTPTAISFQCDFTITLPLLSTTTDKFDVSGTGNFEQFNTQDAAILASGFEARFLFTAVSITQDAMDYIYQYTIK
jgi:hypothetical protein